MSSTSTPTHPQQRVPVPVPDDVAAAMKTLLRDHHIPGMSLAVVDPDHLWYAGGVGLADLATAAPATASTAYLWFSMTKLVTATAALRLADEGRLDLDAPANLYLDYLRTPGARQPTVRELLCHTAGLGNPAPIRWVHLADTCAPDPENMLRRLLDRRGAFRHPVGGQARYSNVGYLAVGQIIAAVTGASFDDHVQRAVLEPCGMTGTGFTYLPAADVATGYVRAPRPAHPMLRRVLPPGIVGAAHDRFLALHRFRVDGAAYGGLIGDVVDASRFLQLHLNDGTLNGERVLATDTAVGMRQLTQTGRQFDHATGWFRRPTTRRGDWVEHFGAGAGFWNVMRLYPDRGIGIVAMTNTTTTYDFEALFDLIADTS